MAVHDAYYTYTVVGLLALGGVMYGVRVALRGAARSERVARIGGTALVGQELMDYTYWALSPFVRGLAALGVTPNALTWAALVLGLGGGVALGDGRFGLASMLATLSSCGDILDGQVARLTKTGSSRGELLDAVVDRYTELAFLGGLLVYFRFSVPFMVLTLAALIASFMISYASAKAEALQVSPPRGLMRRHERGVYLIGGAGFTAMFGDWLVARWGDLPWETPMLVGLAMVAVVGNIAAILRFVRIARALP